MTALSLLIALCGIAVTPLGAMAAPELLSAEHLVKARALSSAGQRRKALIEYMIALEVAEQPVLDLYLEVAKAHADLGNDIPKALTVLDSGLGRLGSVASLQDMAIGLELRRRHYVAALTRQQTLLDSAKQKETRLFQRGQILAQAGRRREARTTYQQVLDLIERQPEERRKTVAAAALKKSVKEQLRLITKKKKNKTTAKSAPQPGK